MTNEDQELQDLFYEIKRIVKTPQNYIPRDYQTVGGSWTVDCWQFGNVKYRLMDEGYTSEISAPGIRVLDQVSGFTIKEGSIELLKDVLNNWRLK